MPEAQCHSLHVDRFRQNSPCTGAQRHYITDTYEPSMNSVVPAQLYNTSGSQFMEMLASESG